MSTAPEGGDTPITLLPLSVRAINCLGKLGVKFASQLSSLDLELFARVYGVGRRTLEEVRQISGVSAAAVASPPAPQVVSAPRDICNERLETLNWTTRTRRCLHKAGIVVVRDLASATPESLLAIEHFGRGCLREVVQKLKAMGLTLGMRFADETSPAAASELGAISRGYRLLLREARTTRRMPESKSILRGDPRLRTEPAMLNAAGETLHEKAERLLFAAGPPPQPAKLARQLKALRTLIRALKRMHLEDELLDILKVVVPQQSAQMTARRLGWDGKGGATLEATGNQFGLTRERVRQVSEKATTSLRSPRPFAPVLDRALTILKRGTPATRDHLEAALVTEGVSRGPFRLEGVLSAAKILGREAFLSESTGQAVRTAAHLPGSRLYVSVSRIAARSVRRWGATTVPDVAAQAAEKLGSETGLELIQLALQDLDGFRWLDESTGWFWLKNLPRNRLRNQIRKVLSVAPEIPVGELRQAIGRHYRMKGFAPPSRVLLQLCSQLEGCGVNHSLVAANPPLDWSKVLVGSERTMTRVLKELGPVMRREDFEAKCRASGMKKSTFYVYLDYSPIVTKYSRGVYGLIGSPVAPGLVESLMPTYRPKRVLKDYGWTSDGRVWVDYELSRATIENGVISLPAGMRKMVQGRFGLKTEDGADVGALVAKANQAWGLGPLFRRRGGDRGDHLILVIDLSKRNAVAMIGSPDIADRLETQ